MINIKSYILVFFLVSSLTTHAQSKNDSVFSSSILSSFKLTDAITHKIHSLPASKNRSIFVFLSPECPICRNYTSVLNKLQHQYSDDVQLYAIIPGKTYSAEAITTFAKKFQITFPLFNDASMKLSHYLQATVTPEVVFLNMNNELIYRGAIDNWFLALGKARAASTENYLQDAIASTLGHQPVAVKRTNPVGCLINDF